VPHLRLARPLVHHQVEALELPVRLQEVLHLIVRPVAGEAPDEHLAPAVLHDGLDHRQVGEREGGVGGGRAEQQGRSGVVVAGAADLGGWGSICWGGVRRVRGGGYWMPSNAVVGVV